MPYRLLALLVLASLPLSARAQAPASDLARGRHLYETHCVACHGPKGEGGKGPTLAQPTLPRASDMDALMRIIRGGISGTEMPGFRFDPGEVPVIAAYVKSLGSQPAEKVPGDPAKGEAHFMGKGACLTCHTLRGQGAAIGPDLTEIGRKRSAAALRKALVEPAAEVPQSFNAFRSDVSMPDNFLFLRATTKSGESVAGVRVNEDTFSVQIRDLSGKVHSFFKSDLREYHKDWGHTPMPPYGAIFAPAELDDVIAYLVSLRTAPKPMEPEATNKTNTILH